MPRWHALTALASMFWAAPALAQSSEGGTPTSFDAASLRARVPSVSLPPPDLARLRAEDALDRKDVPWRFGATVPVSVGLDDGGLWEQLPNGDFLWRLQVDSPGARSLNFVFDDYDLPPGATLFLYSADRAQVLGAFTDANNQLSGSFATALIASDSAILEYREPAAAERPGRLRLQTVTHGYRTMGDYRDKDLGDSGSCNNNVRCGESAGWEDPIRATVLLLTNSGSFCTGALINNASGDGTPYVLTANHCYSNPANWVFWFNWEAPTCANPSTPPPYETLSGATLRARRADSDFCLVEVNSAVANFDVYLAGFDASGVVPSSTRSIHHPSGDIKKISYDNDSPGFSGYFEAGTTHWEVLDWDDGTTEGGSSGGPLFDQDQHIIGQLHGGGAACGNNDSDFFGRLSLSWDGPSRSARLRDWLDPQGTGALVVDGLDPNSPVVSDDASVQSIDAPTDGATLCDGTVTPRVTIRNRGSASLSSVELRWSWDGGPPATSAWTGSLPPGGTASVSLASSTLGQGAHALLVTTRNPNGTADENPGNDSRSVGVEVDSAVGRSIPVVEGFEGGVFPPIGWSIIDPDAYVTWERNGQAGGFGASSASASLDNFNEDFAGQTDGLHLPRVDLSRATSPVLGFSVAYAPFDSRSPDGLGVSVSTDCGQSWERVYYKEGTDLDTAGRREQDEFVPAADEWRRESVDLGAFVGSPRVLVSFDNVSGYGNVIYVDDVELADAAGDADTDTDSDTDSDTGPVVEGVRAARCGCASPGAPLASLSWLLVGLVARRFRSGDLRADGRA